GYKIWYANYLASLPKQEEKPDTKFGVLPPPNFPPTTVTSSNYSYSIDTTTGGFPKFDKIIKVFFLPKAGTTLLASDNAISLAGKFGFINPPQILSDINYLFLDSDRRFEIQLDTGNFKLTRI